MLRLVDSSQQDVMGECCDGSNGLPVTLNTFSSNPERKKTSNFVYQNTYVTTYSGIRTT